MEDSDQDSPLRVLAVDSDQDSLLILEKALQLCNYNVTKCNDAEECLTMVREGKTKFDLVIIDVDLATIDGYELCSLIRKENDVPTILMSSTYINVDTVQKALSHGACDFLLKPIGVENLRQLDLDTLRSRVLEEVVLKKEEREVENVPNNEERDGNNCDLIEKRKGDSISGSDPRSGKKPRVIWTSELHEKFVEAIDSFGLEKAVPKKILEMMNIPGLTRENVASHLQKFRQYHKRMQENSQPKPEKQPRRQQQQQKHEPKSRKIKIEPQPLQDPSTNIPQADTLQAPSPYPAHPNLLDTTYEALLGLRMDPTYNETMMGLKMDPTTGYVYSSDELCQYSFQGHLPNEVSGFLPQSLTPRIEASYDQSRNLIEDNFQNFGNSIHSASPNPALIQISRSHPNLAGLQVDKLRQGGSKASQTNQKD